MRQLQFSDLHLAVTRFGSFLRKKNRNPVAMANLPRVERKSLTLLNSCPTPIMPLSQSLLGAFLTSLPTGVLTRAATFFSPENLSGGELGPAVLVESPRTALLALQGRHRHQTDQVPSTKNLNQFLKKRM